MASVPNEQVLGALQLLRQPGPATSLQTELARRLDATVRSLAAELRDELPAWRAAVQALDALAASRFLPPPAAVQKLRGELEQAQRQAAELLRLMDGPAAAAPIEPPVNPVASLPRQRGEERPPAPSLPPLTREARCPNTQRPTVQPSSKPKPSNVLRVQCPDCGAAGAVRWDRLGHVLLCKGCARHYRVKEGGQVVAVARTTNGKWIESTELRQPRFAVMRRSLVAAVLLVVGLGAGAMLVVRSAPASTLAPLPTELEPRAELLARAWLTKDLPLLRRLTLSTHERTLYPWLLRHAPPLTRKVEPADLANARFEVALVRTAGQATEMRVRVHGVASARDRRPLELTQRWEQRDGIWLFTPPSR